MCWKKESIPGCIKMDCGWTYGPSWQKLTGMFKRLYKCSYVKNNRSNERFEYPKGITNVLSQQKSLSSKATTDCMMF